MSTVKRVFVHQFLISSIILLGALWNGWWTCLTWLDCRVLIPPPVLQRIVGTPSSRMVGSRMIFPLVLCVQVEKPLKASTSSLELTWSCKGTHRPPLTTTPGSSPLEGQFSRWTWRASLSTTRLEYVQQRRPESTTLLWWNHSSQMISSQLKKFHVVQMMFGFTKVQKEDKKEGF